MVYKTRPGENLFIIGIKEVSFYLLSKHETMTYMDSSCLSLQDDCYRFE